MYRSAVIRRLDLLSDGSITVIENELTQQFAKQAPISRTITISDQRFWKELALGGGNGAGESYIMGWWQCDDLVKLIRILCRNRQVQPRLRVACP